MDGIERPAGIGPLISGWDGGDPVYFWDIVLSDGSTQRMAYRKGGLKLDRAAKATAVWERSRAIQENRPRLIVTHDLQSFETLVETLSARTDSAPMPRAA